MILYNVTVSTDESIHDDWLNWMKETHIPEVIATGFFSGYKIFRIISDEPGEKTYSIQYFLNSMEEYETYRDKFAPALQAQYMERYRDKFTAFRTLLESVE